MVTSNTNPLRWRRKITEESAALEYLTDELLRAEGPDSLPGSSRPAARGPQGSSARWPTSP